MKAASGRGVAGRRRASAGEYGAKMDVGGRESVINGVSLADICINNEQWRNNNQRDIEEKLSIGRQAMAGIAVAQLRSAARSITRLHLCARRLRISALAVSGAPWRRARRASGISEMG